MSKVAGFLAGLMSGAIVGSVSALLLAPMSGRDLQTRARDQFDHLVDDARSAAKTRRVQLEAKLESLKAPKPAQ